MKIAHKIMIAPLAAMALLAVLGFTSITLMNRQGQSTVALGEVTVAGFKSGSAQSICRLPFCVLHTRPTSRLSTWASSSPGWRRCSPEADEHRGERSLIRRPGQSGDTIRAIEFQ